MEGDCERSCLQKNKKNFTTFWEEMKPLLHINCPHFSVCSGCQYDIDVANIPLYQEAIVFFHSRNIALPPLHTGSPIGWRIRAKLAVRGDSQNPFVGLFEEGSHKIVDIPFCRVHHPSINVVIEKLKSWVRSQRISPYREESNSGILRYVQCSVERSTGRVQLVLVINETLESIQEPLRVFCAEEKELLHSVWVNINRRTDNVIFGDYWELFSGEECLWETLCGVSVCFHPACFIQANLEMYEQLLTRIISLIPSEKRVLEMYAGVGAIGLCLVDKSKEVCCVEISPEASQCFERSLELLPQESRKKITLRVSGAKEELHLLNTLAPQVLVVDPPRKGLDRAFIEVISSAPSLEQIIYVSCGWNSFKRDCELLNKKGWTLRSAEAFLFFPGTNHLELLTVFSK